MSSHAPVRLATAALVELAGSDAQAFAQAQFSSDVARLGERGWQWSAWLDAQGRVRNVFALLRPEAGRLLAWLPLGDADVMAAHLTRYVLRSRLTIRSLPEWQLLAAPAPGIATADLGTCGSGWSIDMPGTRRSAILLPGDEAGIGIADPQGHALEHFRLADIAAGLPWLAPPLAGEFTAPALGLAGLGATSLDKGCYPGQEIVARLHYRGGNKQHCRALRIASTTPPVPGERILAGPSADRRGTILYAARSINGHSDALAVLHETIDAQTMLRLESGARAGMMATPADMAQ